MVEGFSKMESIRKWVVEHKLRAVGCLWISGIAGSMAYNWSRPNMKPSVKIIHARLHAQALTLAALAGAAVVEYYDHKSGSGSGTGSKVDKYANQFLTHSRKD
ncbi:putative hypoxia induced protein [Dioscorea sansibarensis]